MLDNKYVVKATIVPHANVGNDMTKMPVQLALFGSDGEPLHLDGVTDIVESVLVGYAEGLHGTPVTDEDTVIGAIGKLEKRLNDLGDHPDVGGAEITGYAIGDVEEDPLTPTDTILEALGKLEKRIADLEAVVNN